MSDPARPAPRTPDQPLRSDATDDEIASRIEFLATRKIEDWLGTFHGTVTIRPQHASQAAREHAAACVAEKDAELAAMTDYANERFAELEATEDRLRAELAALLPGSRHADAARPASEREALAWLDEFAALVCIGPRPHELYAKIRAYIETSGKGRSDGGEDTRRLDWLEAQGNGSPWIARQSGIGRGYRLHNTTGFANAANAKATAREAIDAALSAGRPA